MSSEQPPAAAPVVLAIQNDPTDPPLMMGEWLAEEGITVQVVEACFGASVPSAVPDGVHGLLPLGGTMGAQDDHVASWLPAERELLADAVSKGIPVLGLCLGGQLLAAANGGTVQLGPTTEIGVVHVQRTAEGMRDRVIGQAVPVSGNDVPAAQWHQDHITELPDGAVLLMSNDACRVQAFRLGEAAYGLQLHAELDAQTFADWAGMEDEALERSGVDPSVVVAGVVAAEPDLIAAWRPVARAWADLVWERAKDA